MPATPPGASAWAYHLVDVLRTEPIAEDAVAQEILRVFRATGSDAVIPTDSLPRLEDRSGRPLKLTPTEEEAYRRLKGHLTGTLWTAIMQREGWAGATPAVQEYAAKRINDAASDLARTEMLRRMLNAR